MSHLRQFPVDVLWIASEFVRALTPATARQPLPVPSWRSGRSLDIEAVAEGIETLEQAERMRSLGCTYGQGYLFSRPLAGAQFRTQTGGAIAAQAPAEQATDPAPEGQPARRRRTRTRNSLAPPNPSAG